MACTEAKAFYRAKFDDSNFIEILMILTKYVFNVRAWLTKYSATVGSTANMSLSLILVGRRQYFNA